MAGKVSGRTASGLCSRPLPAGNVAQSPPELPSSSSAAAGLLSAPFPAGAAAVSEGLRVPARGACAEGGGSGRLGGHPSTKSCSSPALQQPGALGEPAGGRGPGGHPASPGSEGLGLGCRPRCHLCCLDLLPPCLRGRWALLWAGQCSLREEVNSCYRLALECRFHFHESK